MQNIEKPREGERAGEAQSEVKDLYFHDNGVDGNNGGNTDPNGANAKGGPNTNININKRQLAMKERRAQVASLMAQSRTEEEIAHVLGVDQSTISRDIQALKDTSRHFIHDLAKNDLVFSFQQSIRGVDEVKRRLWDIATSDEYRNKEKLMAYRLIMVAEETKFRLLERGPLLLSQQSIEEKIMRLEKEEQKVAAQQ